MPDTPVPLPRPTAPAACWRCGGPRALQETHAALCETCLTLLDEIARRYQGRPAETGETPGKGDEDG